MSASSSSCGLGISSAIYLRRGLPPFVEVDIILDRFYFRLRILDEAIELSRVPWRAALSSYQHIAITQNPDGEVLQRLAACVTGNAAGPRPTDYFHLNVRIIGIDQIRSPINNSPQYFITSRQPSRLSQKQRPSMTALSEVMLSTRAK